METFKITVLLVATLLIPPAVWADYPVHPRTDFIWNKGEKIMLRDGADLSWKDLRNVEICYSVQILKNVNFAHSELSGVSFREVDLVNCSFKNARIYYGRFDDSSVSPTCDFTDAVLNAANFRRGDQPEHIRYPGFASNPEDLHRKLQIYDPMSYPDNFFRPGIQGVNLTREQLESTRSFKMKDLRGISFSFGNFSGADFSHFDLRGTSFGAILQHCNFMDARIEHASFGYGFTWEQLQQTKDYKEGKLRALFLGISWPDGLINLSRFDLSGTYFGPGYTSDRTLLDLPGNRDRDREYFENLPVLSPGTGLSDRCQLDLTDAVITNCNFKDFKGITLENIKSTWNYKNNRMEGIILPPTIQQALDVEKVE